LLAVATGVAFANTALAQRLLSGQLEQAGSSAAQ
jgi:hypothetical protein